MVSGFSSFWRFQEWTIINNPRENNRNIIRDLEETGRILAVLSLTAIPHFTTLLKFLRCVKSIFLIFLFLKIPGNCSVLMNTHSPSRPSIHPDLSIYVQAIIIRWVRKNIKRISWNFNRYWYWLEVNYQIHDIEDPGFWLLPVHYTSQEMP